MLTRFVTADRREFWFHVGDDQPLYWFAPGKQVFEEPVYFVRVKVWLGISERVVVWTEYKEKPPGTLGDDDDVDTCYLSAFSVEGRHARTIAEAVPIPVTRNGDLIKC